MHRTVAAEEAAAPERLLPEPEKRVQALERRAGARPCGGVDLRAPEVAWVERFDRRGTEPFELFGSKFGPQFCQNLRKICQNSSEIVKFEGC